MNFVNRHDIEQHLASITTSGYIVEVGVGYGNGIIALSKGNVNKLPIIGIDPYYDYTDKLGGKYGEATKSEMRTNTAGLKFTLIKRPAMDAVKLWTNDIGLLWLDLSMEYAPLKQIFDAWARFVVVGGYVGITGLEYMQLGTEQVMNEAAGFTRVLNGQRFVAVLRRDK